MDDSAKIDRAGEPLKIAYIIGTYPGLTTTFIDREIQALRRRGVELQILSIRRPWSKLSPEQEQMQTGVIYLLPVDWAAFLRAQLTYLSRASRVYIGLFFSLLASKHPSLKARAKTVLHFAEGVYAAYLLRGTDWKLLHAHFADRAAVVAQVAGKLLGVPYSFTAHASEIYVDPVLLEEKIARARFVVTCTEYNRRHLAGLAKGEGEKIRRIYHGLDMQPYQRTPVTASKRRVILAVGQLMERKGFLHLVRACSRLVQQGLEFECQIIGEGAERERLAGEIERLGLQQVVKLCGALPHPQVIAAYNQADVFVMPAVLGSNGDRDGIPNVILEAMAMQLPVVATRHSGIPEVVREGENGFLVEPGDEAALANAILKILEDPQMSANMGACGREVVLQNFDLMGNADRLLKEFTAA